MPFWFPLKLSVSFDTPLKLIFDPSPEPSQAGVEVITTFDGFTAKGRAPMAYTLPDDKTVVLDIKYVDAKGHPASIDGDVAWESSDDTICTVNVLEGDSTKAKLSAAANLGNAQVSATADADLGEGVKHIVTLFDLTVVGGQAVAGTITPNELQPTPIGKKK
jgi:hypothetical protein